MVVKDIQENHSLISTLLMQKLMNGVKLMLWGPHQEKEEVIQLMFFLTLRRSLFMEDGIQLPNLKISSYLTVKQESGLTWILLVMILLDGLTALF